MMVLGIDPIQRLVVPRVLACMLVAVFLNGLVSVVGVAGGYVFNVVLQDGTPGAYLASFTALAQLPDLWQGMAKALVFGLIAAIVASYKGMNAGGGPEGRGRRGQRVRRHHLHAAVRRQLRDERDLLPARPTEDGLSGAWPTSRRSTSKPLRSLDDLGDELAFYITRPRVDPAHDPPLQEGDPADPGRGHPRLGRAGRHRRHRRRDHRACASSPAPRSASRATPRSTRSAPPPSPASSRPTSTPARSRRWSPASPWPRPSAAASPPSSARCGSPRRSTPSR